MNIDNQDLDTLEGLMRQSRLLPPYVTALTDKDDLDFYRAAREALPALLDELRQYRNPPKKEKE